MGIFDLLFGQNDNGQKDRYWQDREMANMYEQGWDEPEDAKCDKEELRREKFANYEYADQEDEF